MLKCTYVNILGIFQIWIANIWSISSNLPFGWRQLCYSIILQLNVRADVCPWTSFWTHMMGMDSFNLTASITHFKQSPPFYPKSGCVCHVYECARVGPCPLCARRILTAYWQDVDYPACGRMRPVWTSGGSHSTEEWWDNQTERERERRAYVRAEDDDNKLSVSADMNTALSPSDYLQHRSKCDTHKQTHMLSTYMHFRWSPLHPCVIF